ncbi:hypothetical protein [Sinorhizobium meliloti]|uniref:hypothetical protein n=1 Tax=Rhizobium meliloti TaxID=382 RepID=UPI0013145AD0|nr:hypothetical protein [Sinorhizobium meliloti]MDE4620896.1 hypothetical protein [Sinorhizobium meliloti]
MKSLKNWIFGAIIAGFGASLTAYATGWSKNVSEYISNVELFVYRNVNSPSTQSSVIPLKYVSSDSCFRYIDRWSEEKKLNLQKTRREDARFLHSDGHTVTIACFGTDELVAGSMAVLSVPLATGSGETISYIGESLHKWIYDEFNRTNFDSNPPAEALTLSVFGTLYVAEIDLSDKISTQEIKSRRFPSSILAKFNSDNFYYQCSGMICLFQRADDNIFIWVYEESVGRNGSHGLFALQLDTQGDRYRDFGSYLRSIAAVKQVKLIGRVPS